MLPTIEDIAVKTIVSVDINVALKEAIKIMASSNHRNLVVIEKISSSQTNFYLLTINDLIEYKLGNINENILLKELNLTKAKTLKKDINIFLLKTIYCILVLLHLERRFLSQLSHGRNLPRVLALEQ